MLLAKSLSTPSLSIKESQAVVQKMMLATSAEMPAALSEAVGAAVRTFQAF